MNDQDIITGPVPLPDVQLVFLDQEWSDYDYPEDMAQQYPAADHFVTWQHFAARVDISPEMLEQAVRALLLHHDGLRLRLAKRDGRWRQYLVPPDDDPVPYTWLDISHISKEGQHEMLRTTLAREFHSLSLNSGPVIKCVYIKRGGDAPGLLCVILNHIIGDGMAVQILGEDLVTALIQLRRDEKVLLPPVGTSVKTWQERVEACVHAREWEEDLERLTAYKRSWSLPTLKTLPLDYAEEKPGEPPTEVLFSALSPEETETLLKQARKVWKVRLLDLLQTAMVKTIAPWVGVSSLPMCVIVNGRDPVFDDIDVSRTVGSFAMGVLEVMDVKEDMRPVLSPLADPRLIFAQMLLNFSRSLEKTYESDGGEKYVSFYDRYNPQVVMNFQRYTDPANQPSEQKKLFQPLPKTALYEYQELAASKSLGCFARIEGGRFYMDWQFSPGYFKRSTIEQLVENYLKELRAFINQA